jgi:hypothetical protein
MLAPQPFVTNYPSSDISEFPTQRISNYPSSDISEFPTQRISNYPSSDISEFPTQRISNYPSSGFSQFPTQRFTNFPSGSAGFGSPACSEDNLAGPTGLVSISVPQNKTMRDISLGSGCYNSKSYFCAHEAFDDDIGSKYASKFMSSKGDQWVSWIWVATAFYLFAILMFQEYDLTNGLNFRLPWISELSIFSPAFRSNGVTLQPQMVGGAGHKGMPLKFRMTRHAQQIQSQGTWSAGVTFPLVMGLGQEGEWGWAVKIGLVGQKSFHPLILGSKTLSRIMH